MARYDYYVGFAHNEKAYSANPDTGELKQKVIRSLPDGKEFFIPEEPFYKCYKRIHEYLLNNLTVYEMNVVNRMISIAKRNTNSLIPLNDGMSAKHLSEILFSDRKRIKKILERLFDLGVYGKFEIAKEVDKGVSYKKYWILNPYISFEGKIISTDIKELFEGTVITNIYYH
jgi:predicted transcriptional regulator